MTRYDNPFPDATENTRKPLTLLALHTAIRDTMQDTFPDLYWVRAETSDVHVNSVSGHCYLEFIEKDEKTGQTVAKARATIWARTFQLLKAYFEKETKQSFVSGLKVLVYVSVEFHELYGYSLNVSDIDPTYTVGDMVRRRAGIIRRLQAEGIYDMNRELPFPLLPRRVAVITSPTAAGYEDFVHQLTENEYGFPFYIKLFPAIMQGEKTEESVIAALDRVFLAADRFDVVVLIRGGGSTSDLNSFDTYSLAANCAQFPLPLITGIGHERDDTLLDMVAHTRLKTPTAVASFLIECMIREAAQLQKFQKTIYDMATGCVMREKSVLQSLSVKLPVMATGHLERHRKRLQTMTAYLSALPQWIRFRMETLEALQPRLQRAAGTVIVRRATLIDSLPMRLRSGFEKVCAGCRQSLELNEQYLKMVSPDYILKRGYSLTYKQNKIVKTAKELFVGDEITVKFADGEKQGRIRESIKN